MTAPKRGESERPRVTEPWPELFDALCTIEATRMRAERLRLEREERAAARRTKQGSTKLDEEK